MAALLDLPRLLRQNRTSSFWEAGLSSSILKLASAVLLASLAVHISVHVLLSALPQLCAVIQCYVLRHYIFVAVNVLAFAVVKRSNWSGNQREARNYLGEGDSPVVDEETDGDVWFDAMPPSAASLDATALCRVEAPYPTFAYGTPASYSPVYDDPAGRIQPALQTAALHREEEDDPMVFLWNAMAENPPPSAPLQNADYFSHQGATAVGIKAPPTAPSPKRSSTPWDVTPRKVADGRFSRNSGPKDESHPTPASYLAANAAAGTMPLLQTAALHEGDDSMDSIWSAIGEKPPPRAPYLSKSNTWEVAPRVKVDQPAAAAAAAAAAELRKSETFREENKAPAARRAVLEKRLKGKEVQVFEDYDDMNVRFDAFISKFKDQQRLQRLASLRRRRHRAWTSPALAS